MLRSSLAALAAAALFALPGAEGATTIDLTTAGASETGTGTVGGTFQVQQISPQSTGTGVIDSFLRIQKNDTEQGYNTSLGTPLDDKAPSGGFTRALNLNEIPTVTLGGITYLQFLLDINQNTGSNHELL